MNDQAQGRVPRTGNGLAQLNPCNPMSGQADPQVDQESILDQLKKFLNVPDPERAQDQDQGQADQSHQCSTNGQDHDREQPVDLVVQEEDQQIIQIIQSTQIYSDQIQKFIIKKFWEIKIQKIDSTTVLMQV